LITALGCGIGKEEYEPNKLRYHSIIIMADADVDGSHIRALLLTFFYRHMPELIERGHLYIAQPPLYKTVKGKQEQYIKDDKALNDYLLALALQNAQLYVHPSAPPLNSEVLEKLCISYLRTQDSLARLARHFPVNVLQTMLDMPPLLETQLNQEASVTEWLQELEQLLNQTLSCQIKLNFSDSEHWNASIMLIAYGVESSITLSRTFFLSVEYVAIRELAQTLQGLLEAGAYVQRGDKQQPVRYFREVVMWLLDEARRGLNIQRYKGLGEMNPQQLWDTTMNPNSRNLLQVRIEDAIATDEIFSVLMGDQVEPRREFIEQNALFVSNLDA
jgi:DNA gyrase subunit B